MVKITGSLICLLTLALAATGNEPRVHAVFVVDTFSDVGQFVRIDKHNILRSIHGGFRDANQEHRLSYVVLEGQGATPPNVIQHIRAMQPGPDDTVMFYYAGHGAYEQGRGHFLKMTGGRLFRSTLKQEMDRHNVRLKIILTESCSNMIPPMHFAMKPGVATGDWETISQLMFSGSGTVDVNSCKPGQIARAGGGTGAIFTYNLSQILCGGRQGPVSWPSLLAEVGSRLERHVPRHMQSACVYSIVNDAGAPGQTQPLQLASQQQQQPAALPQAGVTTVVCVYPPRFDGE